MPTSLMDIVSSLYGGQAAPPVAPAAYAPAPASSTASPADPIVQSNGEVLARLKSAAAAQPAQTASVFSGVPDVVGKSKWGAFFTGLSSGMKDAATQSQLDAKMQADAAARNFSMLSTLYNAQRGANQDDLAQQRFGYEQSQGAATNARADRQLSDSEKSSDRTYELAKAKAGVPEGFQLKADGTPGVEPIPGGPQDPKTIEAASTARATDVFENRKEAAKSQGLVEGTPEYQSFVLYGKPLAESKPMNPTEAKIYEETSKRTSFLDESIKSLQQALDLNDKIYDGMEAPFKSSAASVPLVGGLLADKDKAARTTLYDNLTKGAAFASAKEYFPGRVTNFDEKLMQDITPTSGKTAQARALTLQNMIKQRQGMLAIEQAKLGQMKGGSYFSRNPAVASAVPAAPDATPAAPDQPAPAPPAPSAPAPSPQARRIPQPGDVEKGYRFKGGDPSRQENWEPAQ